MGMEGFFVTLLPDNMEICIKDGMRHVKGKSKIFNIDWETFLKKKELLITRKDTYYIIDNCVELELINNEQDSPYIILRGCFTCFDESIKKICLIVKSIYENISKMFKVIICGELNEFNKKIPHAIYDSYKDKYNNYKSIFGDIKLLIPPSEFYREYKKHRNPIIKVLNKFIEKN